MANGAGRWQAYSRVGTGGWQFLGWTARDQPVLAGPDRDLQCRNETRSTAGTLCRIPPLGSYIRRRSRENVAVQSDAPIPARLLQRMPLCVRPCLGNP